MGYATLGFPGGTGIQFRIDPVAINWNFEMHTSVTHTVGGRVVQVLGATLSDITIQGLFGEDRTRSAARGASQAPGQSWMLAQRFATRIRQMMEEQSEGSTEQGRMGSVPVFTYPPLKWRFHVYIKDLTDPDGGGVVTMDTGKFSHGYNLTLFIVQDGSDAIAKAGGNNGILSTIKEKAINDYIGRISEGIGWKPSAYNGNFMEYYDTIFENVSKPSAEVQDQANNGFFEEGE